MSSAGTKIVNRTAKEKKSISCLGTKGHKQKRRRWRVAFQTPDSRLTFKDLIKFTSRVARDGLLEFQLVTI